MTNKKSQLSVNEMLEMILEILYEGNENTKNLESNQNKFVSNLRQSIDHKKEYEVSRDLQWRLSHVSKAQFSHISNMNSITAHFRAITASFKKTLINHRRTFYLSYVFCFMSSFVLGVYCYHILLLRSQVEEKDIKIDRMIKGVNKFLRDEKLEEIYIKWDKNHS